jgi:Uma2 family endonuclease
MFGWLRKTKTKKKKRDILDAPFHWVGEVVEQSLYVSPPLDAPHGRAASRLGMLLGSAFDLGAGGPGGWVILFEPELHLGKNDVLVPDLAGWRRERMPELPNGAAFTLVPDWVCEVTSSATAVLDRDKAKAYARHGVNHLWWVDPFKRLMETYHRPEREHWNRLGHWSGDALAQTAPFEALPLKLATLWER